MRVNFFNRTSNYSTGMNTPVNIEFTGPLILGGDPILNTHIATKQYVDAAINSNLNADMIQFGVVSPTTIPLFTGDVVNELGGGEFNLSRQVGFGGTYTKYYVNAKGLIEIGTHLEVEDIPALPWSRVTVDKATTLEEYGIVDGVNASGDTLDTNLHYTGPSGELTPMVLSEFETLLSGVTTGHAIGDVVCWVEGSAELGVEYLLCDGSTQLIEDYPELYAVLGSKFLVEPDVSFRLPVKAVPGLQYYIRSK